MTVVVVNHIKARDRESYDEIIKLFSTRKRLVDKFPGFKGFKLLASPEEMEIMVMTIWESREDFKRWVESKEFEEGHRRTGERRINADSRGVVYEVVMEE